MGPMQQLSGGITFGLHLQAGSALFPASDLIPSLPAPSPLLSFQWALIEDNWMISSLAHTIC